MRIWGDDRAQSVQVGAILLFGILIIALATVQATVVPDQNTAVEFDHSQAIQSDMQDLRNGLLRAADGDAGSTRLTLGTTYPSRFFFINPPPPTGDLETVGEDDPAMNVTVGNASGNVSVGSDHENAKAYWASSVGAGEYDTSEVTYRPDYAEYDGAPTTVYGDSVLYNTFNNGANRTLSSQRIVQGDTINLHALRGDLDASGVGAYTADVTAVSEQQRTMTVESEPDDPLYVNVTSRLSASVWNDDLLGSQATATSEGTWTEDDTTYHRISIELEEGTYRLRAAAIGVGALTDDERTTEPAYMVVTEEYEPVANGSNGSVTVEVRDRFNNPVTGTEVNASADGEYLQLVGENGDAVNDTTFETDSEGHAEIEYRGVETTTGGASLDVNIGSERYEQASFDGLDVPEFGGNGGDGDELNPGSAGELIQETATRNGDEIDVTFNNTADEEVNISAVRVNFYLSNPPGNSPANPPSSVDVSEDGGTSEANDVQIPGDYVEFSSKITVSDESTLTFAFNDGDVRDSDLLVMTLVYEIDGQTERTTYFVSPQ
ncbi:MAG: hypothetical protein ACOCQU_04700 [Halolamina sp.]